MKSRKRTPVSLAAPAFVAGLLIAASAGAGGTGKGLIATSSDDNAVRAEAGDITGAPTPPDPVEIGVVGIGSNRGVYGSSSNGAGAYAQSSNNYGVWGQSATYRGATGRTDRADNNYGLYTPDNLFSLNYNLVEAVMQVAQNGGSQPLEPGDVVAFSGIVRPEQLRDLAADPSADAATRAAANLGAPIVRVASVAEPASRAVAGVVFSRFDLAAVDPLADRPDSLAAPAPGADARSLADLEVTPAGAAQPGEYLLIVVQGPVEVRVDPLTPTIGPGDLLQSGDLPATAARAEEIWVDGASGVRGGTVIGNALEAARPGQERIYMFVKSR